MTDVDSQMWLRDEIFLYKRYKLDLPCERASAREVFQASIATDQTRANCTKADFMRIVECTQYKTLAEVLQFVMEGKWTDWMNGGQEYGEPTVIAAAAQGMWCSH